MWWQGRIKLDANYKEKSSTKLESPKEVSHLPIGFPKAPSPPAEQARCPGNRQGWTRTHRGRHWSHLSPNQLSTPEEKRADSYWGVPISKPRCPTQVLGAAPADVSLGVILARKWTEGCYQLSVSLWLAICFLSCSLPNLRKNPLSIMIMVIDLAFSIRGCHLLFKDNFPLNIFSIYQLKWLQGSFK